MEKGNPPSKSQNSPQLPSSNERVDKSVGVGEHVLALSEGQHIKTGSGPFLPEIESGKSAFGGQIRAIRRSVGIAAGLTDAAAIVDGFLPAK